MHTPIRDDIDWVGYVDYHVRDFHSYDTERGATYNAYLVRDEKTALIDAVKAPFAGHLLRNVAERIDPAKVDYVVCNHAEPDHAGGLPLVMQAMPQAKVVCDRRCRDALAAYHDTSAWQFELVKTGDRIGLGRRTLEFVETPMVHWPESMVTYVSEEKLLFSMDAFGQHYATSQRFDDELSLPTIMYEAKRYYANIVMPWGKQVQATLEKVSPLPLTMIAPAHGVIWRTHLQTILDAYADWAVCRPAAKVLIVYDSMWESTSQMAEAIAEGVTQDGVAVLPMHVRRTSLTQLATEVIDCAAMALGSATLNRGVMPAAAAAMNYLEGLRPAGKAALAFGCYGWGKGAPEAIDAWLDGMPWQKLSEPLRCQYRPTPELLDECRAAGRLLAQTAKELSA
ncbi:MAG: FprA family A-type flavoprotein [Thermoguttaceae bacterium]|jgi:flavorubredoxin|nr:FprA family A-type flavoprotein [Thermoguttaceae bacterium]